MTRLVRLRHRLEALEARADAVKRKCKTGYSCGSTCITVKKECRRDPQGGLSKERAERLMALARGEIKPRGIGTLKPEQVDQLALEINKFQRTGIKPSWYVEPTAEPITTDDELDTSTSEARMAFVKHMRANSIARPGASFTGNSLAAATLKLCDQPGEVGRNARRMAKYLMGSNVLTVVDDIHPNQRPGAKADEPIKEAEIKHLLTPEAIKRTAENWSTVNLVADSIIYNKQEIAFSRKAVKNIKESAADFKRIGSYSPTMEQQDRKNIAHHNEQIKYAKEGLQISFRTIATALMGKKGAGGLASRDGILRLLDDPVSPRWDPEGLDPERLTRASARSVRDYGQPGKISRYATNSLAGLSDNTMATFIHEVGHMVHYASGDARNTLAKLPPALESTIREADPANPLSGLVGGGRHFVSDYATTNRMEFFAESFTAFVTAPAELRERSPEVYAWVDDTLRRAQAAPPLPHR